MKHLIFASAAALMFSGAAMAQADRTEPVPPGDGITAQGTNPEGTPCTPLGFNEGLAVYPVCIAMGGPAPAAIEDYPPCTQAIRDRCIQTYTRWTD